MAVATVGLGDGSSLGFILSEHPYSPFSSYPHDPLGSQTENLGGLSALLQTAKGGLDQAWPALARLRSHQPHHASRASKVAGPHVIKMDHDMSGL